MNLQAVLAALHDYENSGRLGLAERHSRNLRRFRQGLAATVYESPFYRDLVAKQRIDINTCTPSDFPPMTRADLIESFDRIVTTREVSRAAAEEFFTSTPPGALFHDKYVLLHSSATTGRYAVMAMTDDELVSALMVSARFLRRGARRHTATIFPIGHIPSVALALGLRRSLGAFGDVNALNAAAPIESLVDELNAFQPTLISTYPGMMLRFAVEQGAGRLRIKPNQLQVSGEALGEAERAELEHVFGADVVDIYASCECLYMGWRSSSMPRMRLIDDNVIFEVGHDCLYVTTLFNSTTPLVRYRVDDRLDGATEDESTLTISSILGRSEHYVRLTGLRHDSVGIPSLLVYKLVHDAVCEGIAGAVQVAILSDDVVECRIVPPRGGALTASVGVSTIVQRVRSLFDAQEARVSDVRPRIVAAIEPEQPSGKISVLVDRRATTNRSAIS